MGKKFSANETAQSVYQAIHQAIKDLPREQAIAVLDEVADHCEAMSEGIREEMD